MQNQSVSDVNVTLFAADGKEGVDLNKAIAKKTTDSVSNKTRYWLKFATAGMDRGHLYNPQSPCGNPFDINRFEAEMGRGRYEFKEVKQETFDLYMRFLKTGNPVTLRQAERVI